jgi:hypothetical protein
MLDQTLAQNLKLNLNRANIARSITEAHGWLSSLSRFLKGPYKLDNFVNILKSKYIISYTTIFKICNINSTWHGFF